MMHAMSTDTTIQALAAEAAAWFETATRGDTGKDEDRYVRTKDGRPEWVQDLVQEAHGDMFPDDWKYACVSAALDYISETEDEDGHEFADQYVDVYTSARYAWLGSNLTRQGYIDEAVADLGMEPTSDVAEMIGWGQYMEAREVYGLVWQALEAEQAARVDV